MLLLAACGGTTAAPSSKLQDLNVSFSSISYSQIAIPTAKDSGLLEKNGINANLILGANGIPAMLANEVQVASTSTEEVILADLAGADLEIVATQGVFMQQKLMARPEIKSIADLRNKPVGVSKRGTITETMLRMAADKAGVDFNDFQLVELGGSDKQLAALLAGSVVATGFSAPSTDVAEKQGMKVLYDFQADHIPYSGNSMIVSRDWAQKNPSLVLSFLRALAGASNMTRTDPAFVEKVYENWAKTPPESAQAAVKLAADVVPLKMYPTPEGIKFNRSIVAAQNPAAADADISQFYDDTYIKKLDDEGYYRQFGS
jgi:NitT/TauT family transport system substrate-binding protein